MSTEKEETITRLTEQWYGTITSFDIEQVQKCKEDDLSEVVHRIEVLCYHREEGTNI